MSFSVIYYSDCTGPQPVLRACLSQLRAAVAKAGGELIAVTWQPVSWEQCRNIVWPDHERSHGNLYRQILTGIEQRATPTIILAEHDVLYPPTYFPFMVASVASHPAQLVYNSNYATMDQHGFYRGDSLHHLLLSNLAGRADVVAEGLGRKLAEWEGHGEVFAAEPGSQQNKDYLRVSSPDPTIDIRHGRNFTGPRAPLDGVFHDSVEYWGSLSRFAHLFTEASDLSGN